MLGACCSVHVLGLGAHTLVGGGALFSGPCTHRTTTAVVHNPEGIQPWLQCQTSKALPPGLGRRLGPRAGLTVGGPLG